MCKDSDVFALEAYVDTILSQGDWKDCCTIKEELQSFDGSILKKELRNLDENILKEEYIETIMDRLCTLFPMKYQKQPRIKQCYKRNYSSIKGIGF